MDAPVITAIALSNLHESPFNHRRRFNETTIAELAQDVREVGIQQPLLVRPLIQSVDGLLAFNKAHPDLAGEHDGQYEIVFGARRFRAAQVAGLETVPCMVRELTDGQARRLQISENLQREDVHPIEEAEGFFALLGDKEQPITVDELCDQVGKSRSHVYGRLKLLQAVPQVREACLDGDIDSQVALLIARLRVPKLQEKALAAIKGKYYDLGDGGKKSFRNIQSLLKESFTLDLKEAFFPTEDATLLELAGPCGACPKRSGNAPEFSDIANEHESHHGAKAKGEPNLCTDPDCFDAKKKAHLAREAAKLQEAGKTVVTGGKARAALSAFGELKNGYLPLKDVKAALSKVKKKAGEKAPQIQTVLIQDPRTAKTVVAVAPDAQAQLGMKVDKTATKKPQGNWQEQQRRQEEQRKKNEAKAEELTRLNMAVLHAVRGKAAAVPRSNHDLQMIGEMLFSAIGWADKNTVAELYQVKSPDALAKRVGSMDAAALGMLMLDCTLVHGVKVNGYNLRDTPELLLRAAKHYGVDVKAIKAEIAKAPQDTASAPLPDDADVDADEKEEASA